jgi:NADH-quinone oxidoreductase subunit G
MESANLVIFYGAEGLNYAETDTLARLLANLLLLKHGEDESAHAGRVNSGLVPVWGHSNTQGAWDMGIHPAFGPGYAAAAGAGLDASAIYAGTADGRVSALYVLGTDPVGDNLMDGRGRLDLLVVQELFMTKTAELADVVLPAQSWAEREGTFTNGERRVQRYYPAIAAMGDARPDWQILAHIGERVGLGKPPFAASLVFKEIAGAVPQYKDMDYRTLARVEEQWPIIGGHDLYFGGTAYRNSQGLGQQWASAAEASVAAQASLPANYDLPAEGLRAAATGYRVMRIPSLYTAGTLVDYTGLLYDRLTWPTLFIHPADAQALSYANGDDLAVQADGEVFEVEAVISDAAPLGVGLLCGIASYKPLDVAPATVTRRPASDPEPIPAPSEAMQTEPIPAKQAD